MEKDYGTFPWGDLARNATNKSAGRTIPMWFFRAIDGWKLNVSPHTPPYGFECPPQDPVTEYVHLLLNVFEVILQNGNRERLEGASGKIAPIWPSLWTWLRTISRNIQRSKSVSGSEADAAQNKASYKLLVGILPPIICADPPTPLSILANETKGVKKMMATMWLDESMDLSVANGFRTTYFTNPWFSDVVPTSPLKFRSNAILSQIVSQCAGGADGVARLLLRRIKTNLKQTRPDWEGIEHDAALMMSQLIGMSPHGGILKKALLSHPAFIIIMVDILSLALRAERSHEGPSPTLTTVTLVSTTLLCLQQYLRYTGREYNCAVQLNGTDIMALMTHIADSYGSHEHIAPLCADLLPSILDRFLIYKSFLRPLKIWLSSWSSKPGDANTIVGKEVLRVVKRVSGWVTVQKSQHEYALSCANPYCLASDSGHTFRRCSGCKLVQYCGEGCQLKHWVQEHKSLCSEMCSSGRETVILSSEELRFLNFIIALDYMELEPREFRAFKQHLPLAVSPPRERMLLLDYQGLHPEDKRVNMGLLDFTQPDAVTMHEMAPKFKTTDAWQKSWAHIPLKPHEGIQLAIPLLVLLPRNTDDPQVMTAVMTLRQSASSGGQFPAGKPHIRWIHRM
ncbi:hypothetical protein HWV62_39279 [Athelia sp. TMB]|nr:hypothetical protein HWV62_39279 [Athelia sp. TMB]